MLHPLIERELLRGTRSKAWARSELMIAASVVMTQFINFGRFLVSGSALSFPTGTGVQWFVGGAMAITSIIAVFYPDKHRRVLVRDFRGILAEAPASPTEARFAKWNSETAVPLEPTRVAMPKI